jgi:hypothetical protein
MAILTMEVRGVHGVGDGTPLTTLIPTQESIAQSMYTLMRTTRTSPLSPPPPPAPEEGFSISTFFSEHGAKIGAAVGGLAIGLVIAKRARRRRKS